MRRLVDPRDVHPLALQDLYTNLAEFEGMPINEQTMAAMMMLCRSQ